MATETVRLAPDHADFVDHFVATGRFPSADAVVAFAIEVLEDEHEWQVFIDRINKAYDEAVAARAGAGTDAEALAVRRAFRQARESFAARKQEIGRDDGSEEVE